MKKDVEITESGAKEEMQKRCKGSTECRRRINEVRNGGVTEKNI